MGKLSKRRLTIQALFTAFTNSYVTGFVQGKVYAGPTKAVCVPGLNCYSCPGALGACPIGSLQAVLNAREFQFSCYAAGFLLAVGALLGRFVCGFLCPFGLVQDLLYKIPFYKKYKALPGHGVLKYLKYAVLLIFVILLPALDPGIIGIGAPWFCKVICPSGTLFGSLPLILTNPDLRGSLGLLFAWKLALLLLVIGLSVTVYRPFCKYLCPLGAIYGVFNPVALYRFEIDDRCIHCEACNRACPMDIDVLRHPNDPECIRCGRCREACPTGAIHPIRLGAKSIPDKI